MYQYFSPACSTFLTIAVNHTSFCLLGINSGCCERQGYEAVWRNVVSVRPAWVSWPCVKLCSVLDQVYSSARFNKVDSPRRWTWLWSTWPCPAPRGLSVLTILCRSGAPVDQDLGQQMFQLHSVRKSMTIDLAKITARIHHVVRFELWKCGGKRVCYMWAAGSLEFLICHKT